MSKRKTLEKQYNDLERKKQKLAQEMERLKNAENEILTDEDSSDHEDLVEVSERDGSESPSGTEESESGEIIEEDSQTKPSKENTPEKLATVEKPLTKALQSALGDDPTSSKAEKVQIHSNLLHHWNHYSVQGLGEEKREKLLKKFDIPKKLEAPRLNEQLIPKLKENSRKRDNYRLETQKMVSTALTALGAAITMVNEDEEGIDQEEFLEKMTDAAKAMADTQFQLSEARRAFITPRFTPPFQEILKSSQPDSSYIYGAELASKIKDSKETSTLLKDITGETVQKQGYSENYSRPLGHRNTYNRAGFSNTRGQGRPRVYFKKFNKNQNQPQGRYQNQRPKKFQRNT